MDKLFPLIFLSLWQKFMESCPSVAQFVELFKCCTTSGEKIQRREVSWCGWGLGQFLETVFWGFTVGSCPGCGSY